jgi:hypothetical protein
MAAMEEAWNEAENLSIGTPVDIQRRTTLDL